MTALRNQLQKIDRLRNRWRAEEALLVGATALLGVWFCVAIIDLIFRFRSYGHRILCGIVLVVVVMALAYVLAQLFRRRSDEAVAAAIEKKFPQLDNHLINRIMLANDTQQESSMTDAYLSEPIPGWGTLSLGHFKNRAVRRWGFGGLLVSVLLLLVPLGIFGEAWKASLVRTANPVTTRLPPSFTTILAVSPGNTEIVQGSGVELSVRLSGSRGQSVVVETATEDQTQSSLRLGRLEADGTEQEFTHAVPRLTGTLRYRFKAGDALPTEWCIVQTLPPLAVAMFDATVKPPKYTGLEAQQINFLKGIPAIPDGSEVTYRMRLNRMGEGVRVEASLNSPPAEGWRDSAGVVPSGLECRGTAIATQGIAFRISATSPQGETLDDAYRVTLVADAPPTIRITAPQGTTNRLHAGALPMIQFEARDDYGLAEIILEKIPQGARKDAEGAFVARWTPPAPNTTEFAGEWKGDLADLAGLPAFRLTVVDNRESEGQRTMSSLVVFDQESITEQINAQKAQKESAAKSLTQLILMQRETLDRTQKRAGALPAFDGAVWDGLLGEQEDIRGFANALLKSATVDLGTARVVLTKALEPMGDASAALQQMQTVSPAQRERQSGAAIAAQRHVLKLLELAQAALAANVQSQRVTGLQAIVDALLKGQTETLAATRAKGAKPAEDVIVERQEALAQDVTGLVEFANREADIAKDTDSVRQLMLDVAEKVESLKIRTDMLRATQQLRREETPNAIPYQVSATNSLTTLKKFIAAWKSAAADQEAEDALQSVEAAREELAKAIENQQKLIDALKATKSQGDKTDGSEDDPLNEEVVELREKVMDSVLKVAMELQSMPDLDAANELITELYQVYESMAQQKGSEAGTEAEEVGLAKEDYYLDNMKKTDKKLDEMEHWLPNRPDERKANTENFDQAEMQNAIPKIIMPDELEDLIGDLMEEQKELAEKTDDSYTNQGDTNPPAGWEVAEGETVDYSAAGKSGNRRPDHKDQDGRSQVGREGMADGEVMAKGGKINEGDETIDQRRTKDSSQSGYVDEEDHVDAKATGGGKNSGYADSKGMAGTGADPRRESKAQQSDIAWQEELVKYADAIYAKAQMSGLRIPPGFNSARENIRRAAEAGRAGNIVQMREFQARAMQELSRAKASLEAGMADEAIGLSTDGRRSPDEGVASVPDEAPAEYRHLVSDYFKTIGEME